MAKAPSSSYPSLPSRAAQRGQPAPVGCNFCCIYRESAAGRPGTSCPGTEPDRVGFPDQVQQPEGAIWRTPHPGSRSRDADACASGPDPTAASRLMHLPQNIAPHPPAASQARPRRSRRYLSRSPEWFQIRTRPTSMRSVFRRNAIGVRWFPEPRVHTFERHLKASSGNGTPPNLSGPNRPPPSLSARIAPPRRSIQPGRNATDLAARAIAVLFPEARFA